MSFIDFIRYLLTRRFGSCAATTALILLIAITTFAVSSKIGLQNILNKWWLAVIPSTAIGILALLFIRMNRIEWENIVTRAGGVHLAAWFVVITLYTIVYDKECINMIVYLLGFLFPISLMYTVVKIPRVDAVRSLLYAVHGGVGAYSLVVILHTVLGYARIEFPIIEAKYVTSSIHNTLTLVPVEDLSTIVGASLLPILFIVAAFVEESMFRLSLAVFKRFNMYVMGFLISFNFTYLHVLTRIHLSPDVLYQVITAIAVANAYFIAVYTRTLNVIASTIAHFTYNLLVLTNVPLLPVLIVLIITGVLIAVYEKYTPRFY